MRLLAWNIREGGGSRLVGIVDAIARHDAEVLILSEYRGGASAGRLRSALAGYGYRHITKVVPPPPQRTGVVIVAPPLCRAWDALHTGRRTMASG